MATRKSTGAAVMDAPKTEAKAPTKITGARQRTPRKKATPSAVPANGADVITLPVAQATEDSGTGWPGDAPVSTNLVTVNPDRLYIGADICEPTRLGTGAFRFYKDEETRNKTGFPNPVLVLRNGPVWDADAVDAWIASREEEVTKKVNDEIQRLEAQLARAKQRAGNSN